MKKTITIIALLVMTICAFATHIIMKVTMKDGSVREYLLDELTDVGIVEIDHDYVDLGLPSGTLWATTNLGAETPQDFGFYLAWGETEPKDNYATSTFAHNGKAMYQLVQDGVCDQNGILLPEYDAATAMWGGAWRMPTTDDVQELFDNCSMQWTTIDGVVGSLLTGPSGETIFFPASGYKNGTSSNHVGAYANSRTSRFEWHWSFGNGSKQLRNEGTSYFGITVRPVKKKNVDIRQIDNQIIPASKSSVTVPIYVLRASQVAATSNNPGISVTINDLQLTVDFGAPSAEEMSANITVTASYPGKSNGMVVFNVTRPALTAHDYVDLGLESGTLWATCDLGADEPVACGSCFSFGEVVPRDNYSNTPHTYRWYGVDNLSKAQSVGMVNENGILNEDFDPATVWWGSDWHTANKEQWEELRTCCRWEWVTIDGRNGHRVTGRNGNSIFLPAWGYMRGTTLSENNRLPHYWSSYREQWPWYFRTNSSDVMFSALTEQFLGMHIRPVSNIKPSITDLGEQFIPAGELEYTVAPLTHNIAYITAETTSTDATATVTDGNVNVTFSSTSADDASAIIVIRGFNNDDIEETSMQFKVFRVPADYVPVDLGLSSGTLWSNRNIGAATPAIDGQYVSYGEIEERTVRNSTTTTFYNVQTPGMRLLGALDDNLNLSRAYDFASVSAGEQWRMPSNSQMQELMNECTWEIVTAGNNGAWKVTGPSGNYILLPLSGYKKDNDVLDAHGQKEQLWTATVLAGTNKSYYTNHHNYKEFELTGGERHWGFPVRAVFDSEPSISPVRNRVIPNSQSSCTVTIDGRNIASVCASSSNPDVAVCVDGRNVTVFFGSPTTEERTATITVTVTNASGATASTNFIVTQPAAEEYEYVDLGLPSGTVWAAHNIGASSAIEAGKFVAWGEIYPQSIGNYSVANTSWQGPSADILKHIGVLSASQTLTEAFDAATQWWGSDWHMPTADNYRELINTCTWELTTINEVSCYKITGRNGKSIIIPNAGYFRDASINEPNKNAHLWVSTFNYYFTATPNNSMSVTSLKANNLGMNIRPVRTDVPSITAIPDRTVPEGESAVTVPISSHNVESFAVSSSNPSVATVSIDDANITVSFLNASPTADERVTVTVTGSKSGMPDAVTAFDVWRFVPNTVSFVDLGLPSGRLWADRNVGASIPTEYGKYVSFGETTERTNYTQSSWVNLNSYFLQQLGVLDREFNLTQTYDLAATDLGGNCRSHTGDDMQELIDNCQWTIITIDNDLCWKVTGPNGRYILIPMAGYKEGTRLYMSGTKAQLWASTAGLNNNNSFSSELAQVVRRMTSNPRNPGFPVRAVMDATPQFDFIRHQHVPADESNNSVEISGRNIATISATVDDSSTALVSVSGNTVTTHFSGFSTKERTATVTVSATATTGETASTSYKVTQSASVDAEYVDLGLPSGTLWATANVGASSSEDFGHYFSWGEIDPRSDLDYSTVNTALYGIVGNSLEQYGIAIKPEGKTESEIIYAYDPAAQWIGEGWCMPSHDQWTELQTNCTFTRTTLNGISGHKVTNKDGDGTAWIFLPDAGYYRGTRLYDNGNNCHFWSSSSQSGTGYGSYYFKVANGAITNTNSTERNLGMTIRPVRSTPDTDIPTIAPINDFITEGENVTVSVSTTNCDHIEASSDHPEAVALSCSDNALTINVLAQQSATVKITVRAVSPSGKTRQQSFTLRIHKPDRVEFVDLGLPSGLLWANCNLGADSPEQCGSYYAFGEIQEKPFYSTDTYLYNLEGTTTCMNVEQMKEAGVIDEDGVLTADHDPAAYYLGGDWHTPDGADYAELKVNCSFDVVTIGDTKVTKVTGPNGNAIYLPFNGRMSSANLEFYNSYGEAWCRNHTVNQRPVWVSIAGTTYTLYTNSAGEYWRGRPIRPVRMPSVTPATATLTVSSQPEDFGSVHRAKAQAQIANGSVVNLMAEPKTNCVLSHWVDATDTNVGTGLFHSFVISGPTTRIAVFKDSRIKDIPTTAESPFDCSTGTFSNCRWSDSCVSFAYANSTAVYTLNNTVATAYTVRFKAVTPNTGSSVRFTIKQGNTIVHEYTQALPVTQLANSNVWIPFSSYSFDCPTLAVGEYTLTMTFLGTANYIANVKDIEFIAR